MAKDTVQQAVEQELKRLEYRIDELVQTVERLKQENQALQNREDTLAAERARLVERNELARTRVEAMINRLKAMEQGA